MTIDTRRLALRAHEHMVSEIIRLQNRVVLRKALRAEFGDDAIEPESMMIGRRSVTEAAETMDRSDHSDRASIAALLEQAKELEDLIESDAIDRMAEFLSAQRGKR